MISQFLLWGDEIYFLSPWVWASMPHASAKGCSRTDYGPVLHLKSFSHCLSALLNHYDCRMNRPGQACWRVRNQHREDLTQPVHPSEGPGDTTAQLRSANPMQPQLTHSRMHAAVPDQPDSSWQRFVCYTNACSFKPLGFGVVCYVAVANWCMLFSTTI